MYDDLGRREDVITSSGTVHREYYSITDDTPYRSICQRAEAPWRLPRAAAAGALDFNYEYDSVGNITVIDDQSTTYDASATYTYDARNRLESWTDANNDPQWYTYDALGNLEGHGVGSEVAPTKVSIRPPSPTRLRSIESAKSTRTMPTEMSFKRGLPGGPTEHFVYDSANRLVCTGTSDVGQCVTAPATGTTQMASCSGTERRAAVDG